MAAVRGSGYDNITQCQLTPWCEKEANFVEFNRHFTATLADAARVLVRIGAACPLDELKNWADWE